MTDEAWIDTVRLARDMGTVRELFPRWCDDLRDLPHTLFEAIRLAFMFIGFEELPADEQPPRRIWLKPKQLKAHFAWLKRKREAEAKGGGSSGWDTYIEDPVENEAAKDLLVG